MQQAAAAERDYRNPKIHSDLLNLYTRFFGVHQNMSKYLRIAILEGEILRSISLAMRLTIQINVMKTTPSSSITHDLLAKLHDLRSLVENIKAFTTLLWKTKAISEGFFLTAMSLVEEISKQVVGWEKYLIKNMCKK
jgi:hypothetical protein